MNRILYIIGVCVFVLFVLPTYCLGQEEIPLLNTSYDFASRRSVCKILKDEENLYAIGNYTQKFDLSNLNINLEKEVNNHGTGRDGYVIGDNLYVVVRSNGLGNKYTKVPDIMLDFEDKISDFDNNIGSFDSYQHEGNSSIDETGKPCPNLGFNSAKLLSSDNHKALLEKSITTTQEAFASLWINFEELSNSTTILPLLGSETHEILSLVAYRNGDNVYLGVQIEGDNEWVEETNIKLNEWYNLKIHFNANEIELSYRSKECGSWMSLIKEGHNLNNIEISRLLLGISSQEESLIYIDDYYFHPTDIDAVSYINGTFSIYDKNSMELKSQMHLDIRPNSISVHDNYLYLCCLRGVNVYDISNPDQPLLVGTHRRTKYTEFHGSDTFVKDGRVYLAVSIYSRGIAILDVTDPSNVTLKKDVSIRNSPEWDKCFTFDVVCSYPYAYSTFTVNGSYLFTDGDHRGVLCLDLSNLKNVKQTLYEIPEEAKSDVPTADNQPNRITKYQNKLILNNSTKGMLLFDIGESGAPEYKYCIEAPKKTAILAVSAFDDGSLFAGSTISNDTYTDYGIYWYQFISSVSATIGDKGYTSFSSNYPLDLSHMTATTGEAKAYYASSINSSSVAIKETTAMVPAGEGLILSGIAGSTVNIPFAKSGISIPDNLMIGCPASTTITSETPGYENFYVLVNGDTEVEFQNVNSWISDGNDLTIPAGKAYLNAVHANKARSLSIVFDATTGIKKEIDFSDAPAWKNGKYLENNKFVIYKNNMKFNSVGMRIK